MRQDVCGLGVKQRIVLMNGGLGNQVFQYFFLRWLELLTEESCFADDSAFCVEKPEHNGYELERIFDVKVKRLSQQIPQQQWKDMMRRYENGGEGICQQLYDMGYPVTLIAETDDFKFDGNVIYMRSYDSIWQKGRGFLYFHGYWIHNFWFKDLQKIFLMELRFPPISDEKNQQYADAIRSTKSACVHIRRGDFVQLKYAWSAQLYSPLVDNLSKKESNLTWFVFSDDISWCKKNIRELGLAGKDVVFVEGNQGENAYIDMQLMAMCRHRIVSNSSFSYLAALLRRDRNGIILSPVTGREFS